MWIRIPISPVVDPPMIGVEKVDWSNVSICLGLHHHCYGTSVALVMWIVAALSVGPQEPASLFSHFRLHQKNVSGHEIAIRSSQKAVFVSKVYAGLFELDCHPGDVELRTETHFDMFLIHNFQTLEL